MTGLPPRRLASVEKTVDIEPAQPAASPKKVRRVVRKLSGPAPIDAPTAQVAVDEPKEEPEPVAAPPVAPTPTPEPVPETFSCLKCGIKLTVHTKECPICGEKYVELSKDDLATLERAEEDPTETFDAMTQGGEDDSPCVVFDAEEGVIDFLERGAGAYEVALICSECGTALEFATDKCPVCGSNMDSPDAGLVGLVSEMVFEGNGSDELDCPQCGERVTLVKGKCPVCKESIMRSDPAGKSGRLNPVIHGDNVVFLHLDVGSGELSYLQRAFKKEGLEKMTVKLEDV